MRRHSHENCCKIRAINALRPQEPQKALEQSPLQARWTQGDSFSSVSPRSAARRLASENALRRNVPSVARFSRLAPLAGVAAASSLHGIERIR